MVFFNELADVPADHVPRVTYRHGVIEAGGFKRTRAFNRPYLTPDCARKYGTGPLRRPVAKRDYIVKSFAEVRINDLGLRR